MITAVKKAEDAQIFSQPTPRPPRKIMLFNQHQEKKLFPLVRDRDIGVTSQYQNIIIESYNDDDKQTSSTQMKAGMGQTLKDLYGEFDFSQS